ncbi:hypothetical protein [Brevibacterium sandarakinum]|uniref:hypothetical protein n=1 Tax=Brevibacterium sandarakinum TaxID=629680 RepID=UPI00265619ED|nr:hypothetical protein [Brevibacterium sandarakinum]MDN5658025.1 hypothetical protein [Brevibacterium sandarakinum]
MSSPVASAAYPLSGGPLPSPVAEAAAGPATMSVSANVDEARVRKRISLQRSM